MLITLIGRMEIIGTDKRQRQRQRERERQSCWRSNTQNVPELLDTFSEML